VLTSIRTTVGSFLQIFKPLVSLWLHREVNEDNMLFRNISTEFMDDSAAPAIILVSI